MARLDGRFLFMTEGYHSHLDLLQAAVLRVKLRYVDGWIAARRSRAALYDRLLAGSAVITPSVPAGRTHSYRNYVVRVPRRDRVRAALARSGIDTSLCYIPPLHLQPIYVRTAWARVRSRSPNVWRTNCSASRCTRNSQTRQFTRSRPRSGSAGRPTEGNTG